MNGSTIEGFGSRNGSTIEGFGSRVLNAIDKVAPIAGVTVAWTSELTADGRGMKGAIPALIYYLKNFKIANPIITTEMALGLGDSHFPIVGGITTGALGLGLHEFGKAIGGKAGVLASKLGSICQGFGWTAALNSVAAAYIYLAKDNPHGYSGAEKAAMTSSGTNTPTIDVDNANRGSAPSRPSGSASFDFA